MKLKSKQYLLYTIGLVLFFYGCIRLGVSSLLMLQLHGVLQISALQEGLGEVANFMSAAEGKALMPISTFGYLSYLWVMAVLLVSGALATLTRKRVSRYLIGAFLLLYIVLFINFQTINPKVIHLLVCALLFGLSQWCIATAKASGRKLFQKARPIAD